MTDRHGLETRQSLQDRVVLQELNRLEVGPQIYKNIYKINI